MKVILGSRALQYFALIGKFRYIKNDIEKMVEGVGEYLFVIDLSDVFKQHKPHMSYLYLKV